MTAANILPTLLNLAIAPDTDERWGNLMECVFQIIESPEASDDLIEVMTDGADDDVATTAQDVLSTALRRAREISDGSHEFVDRVTRAINAKAEDLPLEIRLIFARAFIDADLPPPDGLILRSDQLAQLASLSAVDLSTPETLSAWIEKILRDADRDRLALALNLNELLAILPREQRHAAIRAISQAGDTSAQWFIPYWLLDLSLETRRAAANVIADLARTNQLRSDIRHYLATLQLWMPRDEAWEALSDIIAAIEAEPAPAPHWQLDLALASLPDGGGDQMLVLMLNGPRSKDAALGLVYYSMTHGLRDAILTRTGSRRERDILVRQIDGTTPLLQVAPSLVTSLIADGVARRLARKTPAPPGLADYLEIAPAIATRPPEPLPPTRILWERDDREEIANMSAEARAGALEFGGVLAARLPSFETWYEDPLALRDAFIAAPDNATRKTLIFDAMERRRDVWFNQLILTAAIFKAARDDAADYWKACAASALELEAGRACADIPFLRVVAARSWEILSDMTGKGGRGKTRDIALKRTGRTRGGSRRGSRTRGQQRRH